MSELVAEGLRDLVEGAVAVDESSEELLELRGAAFLFAGVVEVEVLEGFVDEVVVPGHVVVFLLLNG